MKVPGDHKTEGGVLQPLTNTPMGRKSTASGSWWMLKEQGP